MSHHFDSAADRADGRINPCDLYAFPGAPGTTALVLAVNPDAGRSSPAAFRPDALYDFMMAREGNTSGDIVFRVTFTEPGDAGQQQVRVLRAEGPAAGHSTAGTPLGEGRTGQVFSLTGDGNGRALGDNAFDIAIAVLAGSALGNASIPHQATPAFPYPSAPQPADLPPLANYIGPVRAPAQ